MRKAHQRGAIARLETREGRMDGARPRSLRRYLTRLALVPLLPVVALTALLVVVIHREHRATMDRGLHATARAVASSVDRKLAATITTLQALASSRHLQAGDFHQFYEDAQRVLPTQPGWLTVHLATTDGGQVLNLARPFGRALGKTTEARSHQGVLETKAPAVGGVVAGAVNGHGGFAVRVPVQRGGVLRYVLSAIVSPTVITSVLTEQNLPAGWLGYVVDDDMRFVARTVAGDALAGEPVAPSLASALGRRHARSFVTTTREGDDVYTAIATSEVAHWWVGLAAPARLMSGGLWSSLGVLAVGSALAVGAAIGLAAVLARRVRRPIAALAEAASAVGRGDTVAVVPTGIDELDAVAGALATASARRRDAEAALRSAKEGLEVATRVKDQVFASVSHELRTPLQAIVGWARALERSNPPPGENQLRAIRAIADNAAIQTRLVGDLLDVARIQSGRLRMKMASVQVMDVIDAAIAAVTPAAEAKTVEIRVEKSEGGPAPFVADADRLRQVMWNLLSNAVKFTPPQGRVHVTLQEHGDHVEITIADTGEGIAAELLPHIFEPFQQGAGVGRPGLGLGLAIARQIVEAHGGAVHVHSAGPGQGSVFRVRLPSGHPRHSPTGETISM